MVESFAIPPHWARICGIDFGWDHPFAAAFLAHDLDTGTVYVYDTYREREATPIIHAAALRARGADKISVAWPADGLAHERGSGEQLAGMYRTQGLEMLFVPARYPDSRSNSLEAGCLDILQRLQTGRFKVFAHLGDWLAEYRLYHRKDGKIVKFNDDLLDATRYGMMVLPYAQALEVPPMRPQRYRQQRRGTWMSL